MEPFRLEPQEEIDAENDWKGTESKLVILAPGPLEQSIYTICEHELGSDQWCKSINLIYVLTPPEKNGALSAGLNPMVAPNS
tara:strand:+ start:159 stop:404 length:246 start_codon:yes stop_codon:yes gene_type:complete